MNTRRAGADADLAAPEVRLRDALSRETRASEGGTVRVVRSVNIAMRTGPRSGFRWTPEMIVYAITLWARKHSRPPFTSEWDQAGEDNPSRQTVARVFGSWNQAMAAAGFDPRPRGRPRRPLIEESALADA
jgi:hypothetical protein